MTTKEVALGSAVMIVRGAYERLSDSINKNCTFDIWSECVYSHKMISVYEKSKLKAPKDNLLTKKYIFVGDISVYELKKLISSARILLNSKVRII